MQPGIEVDKSQILPLRGREGFCRRTHVGHPIQLLVRASNEEARHECTLSGRTQPSLAHRTQGAAQRRQACVPQAQASTDFAGRRWWSQRRGDCQERRCERLDRVPDQATLRGRQSGASAERGAASRSGAQNHRQGRDLRNAPHVFAPGFEVEALLVATACASPPEGRARWTLELLAGAMLKLTEHKIEGRQWAIGQCSLDTALHRLMMDPKSLAHRAERRILPVRQQHLCSRYPARQLGSRPRKSRQGCYLFITHCQFDRSPPSCHATAPRFADRKRGIRQQSVRSTNSARSMPAGFMESVV